MIITPGTRSRCSAELMKSCRYSPLLQQKNCRELAVLSSGTNCFDLFCEALSDRGCELKKHNFAVNGANAADGISRMEERFSLFTPDLLIVAFGMNDFNLLPEEFGKRIAAIAKKAKEWKPEMKFILVSSFPRNPEWQPESPPGPGREFANEPGKIAAGHPEIAVADVNFFWDLLLSHKKTLDLSGNGVNRPDDFGHRLYASVLSALI